MGNEDEEISSVSDEDEDVGGARIIAQLDKLNVYSEGDFFKGHDDTARSSDMFGTLLINFPLVIKAPMVKSSDTQKRDEYTTKWGSGTGLEWLFRLVTLTFTLSFDNANNGAEPFGADIVAKSLDPKIELLHRALTARGIFTKGHPRLCFDLEHRYMRVSNQCWVTLGK
ncbi:uncharacterized protein EI90DRAFT_3044142 [Cantharellus anzutake]|uniref:uncharacterized protein n=1 Tax=Cantharellus anzutake TaxID=1750568 RepID=UPI001907A055|nr:uncharacterized protein EI90DRAFT_3044142 [Cantharellus anzutake]KAF8336919.1 hypothetical protein EI90DRAFT_3044142 [Cantharellus anzutake]